MPRIWNPFDGIPKLPARRPDVDWWDDFSPSWRERVDGRPVDADRTDALRGWDARIRVDGKVPLQLAAQRGATTTYETKRPPEPGNVHPSERLPLPGKVWLISSGDEQWFGIDPHARRYYEASALGPVAVWKYLPASTWRADTIRIWDLDTDYRAQDRSMTGDGLPMWPRVPHVDDLRAGAGGVQRRMALVLAGYSDDPPVGAAVKTDGETPGHPCRAGELLRFTAQGAQRLAAAGSTPDDAAFIYAGVHHGFEVSDKTDNLRDRPEVGHAVRMPFGSRLTVEPRLTDLEVVAA